MAIWSAEIRELEKLYVSIKGQLPDLEKELGRLIKTDDENMILLYSRRCLEVIITDLCECELNRPRKTEPLKGIIDKLHKEGKVPSHIISSMYSLNELSTYGAHPKYFDPEQVKPVLINLDIIIKWYLKHKDFQIVGKPMSEEEKSGSKHQVIPSVEKSIIVLPFENMSPDPDQEYFSDGLTEEIITDLSHIHELLVISRTSAMTFKGTKKTIPEIAQAVNVRYVLEGSVRKAGNNLRITAQLIDSITDAHMWAEIYTGILDDIFDIQGKVSRSIVDSLKIRLQPKEKNLTTNIRAYDLYLLGRYYWNKRTNKGLQHSIECFEQAIQIDEDFALAYAGLSDAYFICADWNYLSPEVALKKAKELAQKAVQLDNNIAEAYATLGAITSYFEFNYEKAKSFYNKALLLNPNYAFAHQYYAHFMATMGQFDEALTHINQALQLDPLSSIRNYCCGLIYYHAEEYDNALLWCEKTLKLDAEFPSEMVNFLMFLCYFQKDLMIEAIDKYQKVIVNISSLVAYKKLAGEVYKNQGKNGFLNFIIDLELNSPNPSTRYLAIFYSLTGNKQKALDYIAYNINNYVSDFLFIKVEKAYINLHSDPRFLILLKKVGFH